MTKVTRPECAGFHEADPYCDGGGEGDEAKPCAYRDRCLALIKIAGGKPEPATKAYMLKIKQTKRRYNERTLGQWMAKQAGTDDSRDEDAKLRRLAAALGESGDEPDEPAPAGRSTRKPNRTHSQANKPAKGKPSEKARKRKARAGKPVDHVEAGTRTPKFAHVYPVIDAINDRIGLELHRIVKEEGDPSIQPGDLFVRQLPGGHGRKIALYEASARKKKQHRLIWRGEMLMRKAGLHLEVNSTDMTAAFDAKPPPGPRLTTWTNMKKLVVLMNVDGASAIETGKWIARLYLRGKIEGDKGARSKRANRRRRGPTTRRTSEGLRASRG